jgi:hypothetical protein
MNGVVEFYNEKDVHPDGYSWETILGWDDTNLEVKHNYIQWLFPLKKASAQVPNSPILGEKEVALFRNDPELKRRLLRSFERMLRFYGFKLAIGREKQAQIVRSADIDDRKKEWMTLGNHNYRRISRILESLRLLGLEDLSRLFYLAVRSLYKEDSSQIGWTTYSYWKEAAGEW